MTIENRVCTCRDCTEKMLKLKAQLEHRFYKEAEKYRNETMMETMKKAAEKYDEPFDPSSWTNEQLARHAMAENYDQTNYIYGMYQRMQEQEKLIKEQERLIKNRESYIAELVDKYVSGS